MIDPEIYDFIRRRRKDGQSDEEIRLTLITNGFPAEEVDRIFSESSTAGKNYKRDDIIHILILLVLISVFVAVYYVAITYFF